ncbi:MAG TPA: DUF2442 domain-containing protein [Ignavibacteria bacterium]|nr:DUF2442 domain-containing protein [Ignavibacteria bacterium]
MNHLIFKVTSCKVIAPYTLEITFNDGQSKQINFEKLLKGEMYFPLKDPEFFSRVSIDPEVSTIVWPNGADFDPAILHDWEKYENEIIDRAKDWDVLAD